MVIELVFSIIPGERVRECVGYKIDDTVYWLDGTEGKWVTTP